MSKAGQVAAATQVGLDIETFKNCVNSAEAREEVQRDIETAREAGVDGTPAYFVNNRRVRGARELERVIEEMLAQKSVTRAGR